MSDDPNVDGVGGVPGDMDGRLADPGFLVNASPEEVLGLLDAASGPAAQLAKMMYLASAHLHRDGTAKMRRQVLALDAARYGDRELSARITAVPVEGEPAARWGVEWATGSTGDDRFGQEALAKHTDWVRAVATAVVDGRPVAVAASGTNTVRVWDLDNGRRVGDPSTGQHDSEACTGRTDWVCTMATTVANDRSTAVTGGWETVRVWDLTTREQVGEPLVGHNGGVWAVATALVNGRPIAVTGGYDRTVRVWDLTSCKPVGAPLTGHTGPVQTVATGMMNNRPIAVTGGVDETVRVWDLLTRKPVGAPLSGHTGTIRTMASAVVEGRPVAVTGGHQSLRVWDLTTGQQIGEPLTRHAGWVATVAVVDGCPVAVTGSDNATVRVWDLTAGQQMGEELVFPERVNAVAVAPDGRLVVGFGREVAVLTLC
ncbi:WD40 repeat domain-containing protein [Streptomyces sp. NPDC051366]|uniref:WD40 repeat domain-containing protein n=1 Tax=Streptomyces sp. NPDC051366 TaxID=3365652 RepID=UPI0037B7753F